MPKITRDQVKVPVDVMPDMRDVYITNYMKATRETGRLMLFACDQKIENMNKDFYGEGIDIADAEPEHLFKIGSQGVCGVLAGQRGLIAQYAADYPEINYLVKMNSKTNLVKTSQEDPYSPQLTDLDAVLAMRDAGVNVVGLGYTIYLGSEYESTMMAEAGELIAQAHANGLLVVLWIYPRGKAVTAEKDPDLIAGAAPFASAPTSSRSIRRSPRTAARLPKRSRSLPWPPAARAWCVPAVPPSMPRRSSRSCMSRSTWAARAATRRGVTSTSVRSMRRCV